MKTTTEISSVSDRDQFVMRSKARELSREFRGRIVNEAQILDVPSIKYFRQYLLEEVIADMESFV